MPHRIFSSRDLAAHYDGALPADVTALATAGTYQAYITALARSAEQRFYRRIHETLATVASWRMTPHPYQSQRLRLHTAILAQCRHKAREAFDLCR